jgi:dihydroorotate dehydrogenase (fumarate)
LIVSSSGLTKDIHSIEKAAQAGAGAIVLKSIFEEQIIAETIEPSTYSGHTEDYDYLERYHLQQYLELVSRAKKSAGVPIIASVNCHTKEKWTTFASQIEAAGADAIELNIMILPDKETKPNSPFEEWYYNRMFGKVWSAPSKIMSSHEVEELILSIVKQVRSSVSIPIAVKLGPYITSLIPFAKGLETAGAKGIVIFNHFHTPDFDINTGDILHGLRLTSPEQMYDTLRWTTLLHNEVRCDLSATGGIHSAETCIKMLLAGARTVQLCSSLYKHGFKVIGEYLKDIDSWMEKNHYASVGQVSGALHKVVKKDIFARFQYIKMYTGVE